MNQRNHASLLAHGACAAALFAAIYALHRHSLGMWGDTVVDYGRELYIAWQVSNGKALYKDVANYFGPLSSLANGLFMSVGQSRLASLQTANIFLTVIMTFLVYGFSLKYVSRPLAVVAGLVFLLFTGLNLSEGPTTNYNFISPYSHELMHALLASFALLVVIDIHSRRLMLNALAAGLLLSMVFLLKSEVAVAAFAATAFYLGWVLLVGRLPLSTVAAYCLAMLLPFLVLNACLLAYYGVKTSLMDAMRDLTFMYRLPLDLPQSMKHFYAHKSGLNNLAQSLTESLKAFVFTVALIVAAMAVMLAARLAGRPERLRSKVVALAGMAGVAWLFAVAAFKAGIALTYVLPGWSVLVLASLLYFARPSPDGKARNQAPRFIFFAAFCVFLLSKIFFRPSFHSYGTFLLFPAILCFFLSLAWLMKQASVRFGFRAAPLYLVPLLVVGLAIQAKVRLSYDFLMSGQMAPLPMVSEPFQVDAARHGVTSAVVSYLQGHAAGGDTLAVLPEGAAFNLMTGMDNPTKYINLIPAEWYAFTAQAILGAYRENRPSWIVLLARDNSLYGFGPFCTYAGQFCDFLASDYTLVMQAGASPHVAGQAFGVEIYRRNDRAAASASGPTPSP